MTAIYARQSIDKKGSLSISGQIEAAKTMLMGDDYTVYADRGASGSNINRPFFKKMIEDIEKGLISRVIIYRFDRISRSLIDFIGIESLFEKHSVTMISYSEQFDTSTEIGRMMLKILIMFAEMERKTIAQRVADNYAYRASEMKMLGGKASYGYKYSSDMTMLIEDRKQSDIVKQIYESFLKKDISCDKIARNLGDNGILSPEGGTWNGSTVAKILKNPLYTMKSKAVENYLSGSGFELKICKEEYNGYKRLKNAIYPSHHTGFIAGSDWIAVQKKIKRRAKSASAGTGTGSFLQGIILCKKCGRSVYMKSNGRGGRYLQCQGRRKGLCEGFSALKAESVEEMTKSVVISQIKKLRPAQKDNGKSRKIAEIDAEIELVSAEIEKESEEKKPVMCIKREMLLRERAELLEKLRCRETSDVRKAAERSEKMWDKMEIESKRIITRIFVEKIYLGDTAEIYMK